MAHLYKRGRKFWLCYYINGQRVQKPLYTDNERIARDKKRKIEYELTIGDLHVTSKLPLPVVLEDFCKYLRITRTHKSYKNEFSRLRVFFGPICESLRIQPPGIERDRRSSKPVADKYAHAHVKAELLEDITPEVINRFLADRQRRDAWSPKTVNLMRQILHRLFAYAIKHHGFRSRDHRYPNPAAGVERLREPAPQIRFLSLEEIQKQLLALEDHSVIQAAVGIYIYAGLRREEALWLTHEDIDLRCRLIRVRAKTIEGEYWQPKTKRNRVVPISRRLVTILNDYRARHDRLWFIPSPAGKRWNPDNFSQDLRKLNKAAGLDWSCLDFRHTFGSHLAQKGVSLYKIAALMGNSPEICRRHYAALIPEQMLETVEFEDVASLNGSGHIEAMLGEILDRLDGKEP
ncbi:MAG: tyrosine-type recombinase/integrase, partial [Sedimentisphaerales bacterium]|nr:tyrosine-type recombinase/integrase [Sedimentisphaerales bacterium]